ncbi:hypothetical protein [Beijerinckia indica]|nr:hypothetical protein [Beijerinckia indica]
MRNPKAGNSSGNSWDKDYLLKQADKDLFSVSAEAATALTARTMG